MNEIFTYTSTNRRRVSVGYKLPDGKVVRLHRKIDGEDRDAIQQAIDDVKARGVKEVVVEAYRPNGSAEVICKTFTLQTTVHQLQPWATLFNLNFLTHLSGSSAFRSIALNHKFQNQWKNHSTVGKTTP